MQERDVQLLMEISPERESLRGLMRGVEIQRTQTVKAGRLIWCKSFPIWDTTARRDAQAALEAKREQRGTTEAQKNLNARKAADRLHQLIENNFSADDLIVTCTYPMEGEPEDLTRAKRDMRNYVARIRRLCEKRGLPAPAYVYVTETKHKKWGTSHHHHMVLKAGITRKEAEELWEKSHGGICNTKVVKRLKEGTLGVGKYLSKQVCGMNHADEYAQRHRWCASKGLKVPEPTEADQKISRRRVERIAEAMESRPTEARAALEKCYPGYEVVELNVKTSRWVTGAYVTAVLARKETKDGADVGTAAGRRNPLRNGDPAAGAADRGAGMRMGRR